MLKPFSCKSQIAENSFRKNSPSFMFNNRSFCDDSKHFLSVITFSFSSIYFNVTVSFQVFRFCKIMKTIIIFQLMLLFWASPAESQQCTDLDWTSTFAQAGDSMSQCRNNVSYVNALTGQGYGVSLQTGPNVIKTARCCGVNLPYSQEENDCYWEQWWVAMAK